MEYVELVWCDADGNEYTVPLDKTQVWAICQILGIQIKPEPDGGYTYSYFSHADVISRVKKAGILVDPSRGPGKE